jgi:hypothetical protein
LAILGGSFRLVARSVLPLALLFILAACGGSKEETRTTGIGIRGDGYAFEAPEGWHVSRPKDAVVVRSGDALVSVTRFALQKPYSPEQFDTVSKALDGIADKLAKAAGSTVSARETLTVSGDRKIRAYRYGGKRIGFVLAGRQEYQLFCAPAGTACDLLFDSFTLTGPSA